MEWLNIHIAKQLRSPEAIGSAPAELGTWVRVLAYCCEQENGGRIAGGADWKDRQWQQLCAVTLRELRAADRLIQFDGADVVVNGYPMAKQEQVQANRERATSGAMAKWGHRSGATATRAQRLSDARSKGRHTQEQWIEMREYYGCCVRCGATDAEIVKDHIVPIYQGGSDGIDNIQPLCLRCNSSKGPESMDWRLAHSKGCKEEWKTPAMMPATSRHCGTNQTPAEEEREREVGRGRGKEEGSIDADRSTGTHRQGPARPPAPMTRSWMDWKLTIGRHRVYIDREGNAEGHWAELYNRAGWDEFTKAWDYCAQRTTRPDGKVFLANMLEVIQ